MAQDQRRRSLSPGHNFACRHIVRFLEAASLLLHFYVDSHPVPAFRYRLYRTNCEGIRYE